MDNFFSNIKLFTTVKDLSIGEVRIVKWRSAFPVELLEIRQLFIRKNNWGMKAYTTTLKAALWSVWQDLGTTQIMTTVHFVKDIEISEFISFQKQRGILSNSVIETPDSNQALSIPLLICKYKKYMGGSDLNKQCKSYYLADIQCFRYWWPLFQIFLDAFVFSKCNLWKILQPNSTLSQIDFQKSVALKLTQNPLAID